MVFPLTLGMAAHQVNLIIDKSIASTVTVGAITALSYASFLYLCIENIIIQNVSTAIFPEIAVEFLKTRNDELIAKKVRGTMLCTIYLLLPIVVSCFMYADFMVSCIYMRGSFNSDSLFLTVMAFQGYLIGLPFLAVRDIITRVFYTYSDTKTPVKIGICSVIINIVLDYILSIHLGLFGITLATSISNALSAILMCCFVKIHNKHIIILELKKDINAIVLILIISYLTGIAMLRIHMQGLDFVLYGILVLIIEIMVLKIGNLSVFRYIISLIDKLNNKKGAI